MSRNPSWTGFDRSNLILSLERGAAAGSGERFRAGIERAVALGWLWRHESGTYLKITEGAALFA